MCVYSGNDTKLMKNAGSSRLKISKVEGRVNYYILGIMGLQVCCCLAASLYSFVKCHQSRAQWVQNGFDFSCLTLGSITFFSYFLLNNTMIPISLIVSLEIVKFAQGLLMQQDPEMFSLVRGKALKCLTVSLNEELGQIQYICTDKTGTLTANKMEFRYLMAGAKVIGDQGLLEEEPASHSMSFSPAASSQEDFAQVREMLLSPQPLLEPLVLDDGREGVPLPLHRDVLREMLLIMGCCHECVAQHDAGLVTYQGSSPDEIAIVAAASRMGVRFDSVANGRIHLTAALSREEQLSFELLYLFSFTSDRKRMSVVVRREGVVKVFCKGADSIIEARLAERQPFLDSVKGQIDEFARKGLRTLLFAEKIVPEARFEAARSAILGALGTPYEKKALEEQMAYFESELMLIGATALEDKLQDRVPETLRDFLKANIKVLMLTGDKLETAQSIARSCNLLPEEVPSF